MSTRLTVAAARRSWGASGNLIRGLEAPVHSPQEQLPALRLLNGVRPAKETTASADGRDHPPPAAALRGRKPAQTPPPRPAGASPAKRRPARTGKFSRRHGVRKAPATLKSIVKPGVANRAFR